MPGGGPWLDRNPLAYVRVKGEADVKRPVARLDRFEATRRAMLDFQARYAEEVRTSESAPARSRARSTTRRSVHGW